MRRSIHVVISVLAVVLLVRPFDCFASVKPNSEAMDCCLKGKCAPTAQSDDCCKNNTAPDSGQLVLSKAGDHLVPLMALTAATLSLTIPELPVGGFVDLLSHPPPSSSTTARSLPLLI